MNRGETGRVDDGIIEVDLTSERRFEPVRNVVLEERMATEAMRREGVADHLRRFVRHHPQLLAVPIAALMTWFALALS